MRCKDRSAPAVAISPDAYSAWRSTTLGAVTERLEQHLILDLMGELSGRRVLDVGCGDGALACVAASCGAFATGIDPNPAMLAGARERAAKAGLRATFLEGRMESLPFPHASFDVVTAVTVLCFVDDAGGAVRNLARVLRPGGRLVIGELGRWSLWAAIRRVRGRLGAATWRHARFRTAGELRVVAAQARLSVIEIRGAVYYPPIGAFAKVFARMDPWLGQLTTIGAAFVVLAATAPNGSPEE
jgi:SAM-dependent methyltransferase